VVEPSGKSVSLPPRSVALVLGTRPEAIKLADLAMLLGDAAWILHTGQHYDDTLGGAVLDGVGFPPAHVELGVGGTSRGRQIGAAVSALDEAFAASPPIAIVVQGDTNATLAGAIAANANEVPVVHVEAGIRSHDRAMPEEHNRVLVDHLAERCCAPTEVSVANLEAESIAGERVVLTGNTIVEAATRLMPPAAERDALLQRFGVASDQFVLATIHRPENVDSAEPLAAILRALGSLPVPVVLPLHPRTAARVAAFGLDDLLDGIWVTDPLAPSAFLGLASEAVVWVSDSGGLQEEASILKRPVVVVRRSTERPEVQGSFAELVAPGPQIGERVVAWLDSPARRAELTQLPSPYGDGRASARILDVIAALA
jgi:UDP-N-acetylglucosamine 2-epimerase (non-hydrolysing)